MLIRPYRTDELDTIKAITVEAFDSVSIDQNIERRFGVIHGHDWKWRKARHIDDDLAHDPEGLFVAEADGEVVGYVSTWIDAEAGIGNIPNLAIRADWRGRGVGRKLIEYALAHFRRAGCAYAKIETLEQNDVGYAVYMKLGFVEVARQVHFLKPLE